jgi:hypothetical protein
MLAQTLAGVTSRLRHIDSLPAATSHTPIAFSRKGLPLGCRHSVNNPGSQLQPRLIRPLFDGCCEDEGDENLP